MNDLVPRILSPSNGETAVLLRPEHLRFMSDPRTEVEDRLDWKSMEASGADYTAPLPVTVRYLPEKDADEAAIRRALPKRGR